MTWRERLYERFRKKYWEQKLRGTCTRWGCEEPPSDTSFLCEHHRDAQRRYNLKFYHAHRRARLAR